MTQLPRPGRQVGAFIFTSLVAFESLGRKHSMKNLIISLILYLAFPALACAWSGIDADTETDVEIEKGNLVRRGKTIEFYDAEDGAYHQAEVESIKDIGHSVQLEIHDLDKGEDRVLLMDKR